MSHLVRFDSFEVDLTAGQLRKRGIRIGLRDQVFQVLASLLDRPGQVISRDELRRRLWRDDVFVDFDNSLNIAIARLRSALGDSAEHPRYIETLPKRGYRFVGQLCPPPPGPEPAPARKSRLMVLPFLNLSGDPGQEYVSDAVTDELITELAVLAPDSLGVIARTTAMRYKGTRKDVARIGRELNMDYVVEGGVRRNGDHISMTVQLIRAGDQTHLFAKRYEAPLRDIFQMQSFIAQDVASHIPSVAAKVRAGHVTKNPTENLAAYNEYIKGRYEMLKWTPEGVAKAKQHFEAALSLDPRFALACDGLANLYGYLGFWGFLPADETESLRMFYGLRALELDPALAEPRTHVAYHPQKCHYKDAYSIDWLEAERLMRQARDLSPNSPLIRVRYSTVLMVLGHTERAVAELECALELDPLSPEVRYWLVSVRFFGRQYEKALAESQRLIEFSEAHHIAYMMLGLIYLGMQRMEESVAALRRAAELSDELPLMLGWLGLALGLSGNTAEARGILERLHAIATQRFVLPTSFAWLHLGLGEIDDAFVWLERAVDRDDEWSHVLKDYSFLDPLHSDSRFQALLRKLNLG
jgi:TolB-like protein/DNA-binding winged helix-turn-helix (wHTH) protein